MNKITINTEFEVFDTLGDLPGEVRSLMENAIQAREKSYSPYSRFRVGAAILMENGEVICGSNQENASYPVGLCAERTAIFYAAAKYPGVKMKMLAISARALDAVVENPTPPCGSCRQAIAEYELQQESPIGIYFMGEKGKVIKADSVADLLPLLFDKSYL